MLLMLLCLPGEQPSSYENIFLAAAVTVPARRTPLFLLQKNVLFAVTVTARLTLLFFI